MWFLFFIEAFVLFLFLHWFAWFFYWFVKTPKLLGVKRVKKKRRLFQRLFIDFPSQAGKDFASRDPDTFKPKGIVVFTGEQGAGKTISMIQYVTTMLDDFPKAICLSNTRFERQDITLSDWRQLLSVVNGKSGVVVVMDELQNWFNSKQSKNFPPEMLSVVTQNRKNHRIICATAQNFYMLSKDIRSQCTEIRQCTTILGCLTFVRCLKPIIDNDGVIQKCKFQKLYFFVHSDKLRKSYDTYAVIESLLKSGFQSKENRYYD